MVHSTVLLAIKTIIIFENWKEDIGHSHFHWELKSLSQVALGWEMNWEKEIEEKDNQKFFSKNLVVMRRRLYETQKTDLGNG
jgi:hypothetical protein